MAAIVLPLSGNTYLEIEQIDDRWFRFYLQTLSEHIPIGGEWLSIFLEKIKKFLDEFDDHKIQQIRGIIAFAEPHSVICSRKISSDETFLQFRNKDNEILWEGKISVKTIRGWLAK